MSESSEEVPCKIIEFSDEKNSNETSSISDKNDLIDNIHQQQHNNDDDNDSMDSSKYILPHLSEGEKLWLKKFHYQANEIIKEHGLMKGLGLSYIADKIGLDTSILRKDVALTYVLWVELLKILQKYYNNFKYQTFHDFMEIYKDKFNSEKESEKNKLYHIANWMNVIFKMITAKKNKGLILDVVTKFVEGWRVKYITGSGQTKATDNRVYIFEYESGIKASPRAPKGLKKAKEFSAMANNMINSMDAYGHPMNGNTTHVKRAAQAMLALGSEMEDAPDSKRRNLSMQGMMFPQGRTPMGFSYLNNAALTAVGGPYGSANGMHNVEDATRGNMSQYPMMSYLPYPVPYPCMNPAVAASAVGGGNGGFTPLPFSFPQYYQWMAAMSVMGQQNMMFASKGYIHPPGANFENQRTAYCESHRSSDGATSVESQGSSKNSREKKNEFSFESTAD